MKNINWTNVVVTLAVCTIFWLFVPSPLHKCPVYPEIPDSTVTVPGDTTINITVTPPISVTDDTQVPTNVISVTFEDEETKETLSQTTLSWDKETVVPLPEGTEARFRSTTYYTLGDSTGQITHEISIPPRPVEFRTITDTLKITKYRMIPAPEQPTPVLESPVFWAVAGAVLGALAVGIIVSKEKD